MNPSDQFDRLLQEIAGLRAELQRLKTFHPAPPELEVFPEKLRAYFAQLAKVTDVSGDDAAAVCARQTLEALRKLNEELRRFLDECFRLDSGRTSREQK